MEQFTQIGNSDNNGIGFNRYKFLKNLAFDDLTEEEKILISDYEAKHEVNPEQLERKKKYIERLQVEKENIEFTFNKKTIWLGFLNSFKLVNGKDFIQNETTLENIKPLMYYFLKDRLFFDCKNVIDVSVPSFEKGLLIIGDFGNGKSSTMLAFEHLFKGIVGYNFKSYNANEVVKMFEEIKPDNYTIDLSRKDFDRKMNLGTKYFDDVKTEREASNYGKVNLFKEILECRYNSKYKTYITCNYKNGLPNDIDSALFEFSEKYGSRVYDRLFEMFNIIQFNGKSMRK